MSPIIAQPGVPAHPDEAARHRRDRLARATPGQTDAALAYLSMIDPLMFEIAMDAADQAAAEPPEDEEPVPVCRRCGGQVGIFLREDLEWHHFHGDGTTAGAQQIYHPGHPAEVTWRLPSEDPEQP